MPDTISIPMCSEITKECYSLIEAFDNLNAPNYGVSVQGLTQEEACKEILEQFWQAVIDGDLIRSIEHDEPLGSGESAIERFDLITRNTQAIETGLYYWVIESEYGSQIGKLVIIK